MHIRHFSLDIRNLHDYSVKRNISEDDYADRVNICLSMIQTLPKNTDCMKYALTEEIYNTWYMKYVATEQLDKFLYSKDIEIR